MFEKLAWTEIALARTLELRVCTADDAIRSFQVGMVVQSMDELNPHEFD